MKITYFHSFDIFDLYFFYLFHQFLTYVLFEFWMYSNAHMHTPFLMWISKNTPFNERYDFRFNSFQFNLLWRECFWMEMHLQTICSIWINMLWTNIQNEYWKIHLQIIPSRFKKHIQCMPMPMHRLHLHIKHVNRSNW